jgi:polyhydroxyalkanoate synthesis regulator phasin
MIRDMAVIQKNGGSVDQFLDRRFMNQGEEDDLLDPQKRIESFGKLASRMKSTINVILKHADLATKIDREQVEALEAKIAELKRFITTN